MFHIKERAHRTSADVAQVKDAHCGGDVLSAADVFEVDFKPRPDVGLMENNAIVRRGTHRGLCAGEEDQVALRFKGKPAVS